MPNSNPIKRLFDLYTSDLTFEEINRLLKRESAEVYKFFSNDIPKPDTTKNKFIRALIFLRSLFNAFILKLSAARRIFYIAALIIFFIGYIQDIGSYLIFAFVILNLLLAFELADKLSTKGELDLARKIQNHLIPHPPYKNPHFDIAAHYEPAKEVGGDYFDIIPNGINPDETYIIIGDISGKGIAAALYMVRVQAIFLLLTSSIAKMTTILTELKNYFSKNLEKEYFLTVASLKIKKDGSLNYCRAGHSPMLHFDNSAGELKEIHPTGIGIGLNDRGIFEKSLQAIKIKPKKDDLFVLFTDGITEAMDEMNEQFGLERLKRIIQNNSHENVEKIKAKILESMNRFKGTASANDDLTIIILKAK